MAENKYAERLVELGISEGIVNDVTAKDWLNESQVSRIVELFEKADAGASVQEIESIINQMRHDSEVGRDAYWLPVSRDDWNDLREKLIQTVRDNQIRIAENQKTILSLEEDAQSLSNRILKNMPTLSSMADIMIGNGFSKEDFELITPAINEFLNGKKSGDFVMSAVEGAVKKSGSNFLDLHKHDFETAIGNMQRQIDICNEASVKFQQDIREIKEYEHKIAIAERNIDILSAAAAHARKTQHAIFGIEFYDKVAAPASKFFELAQKHFEERVQGLRENMRDVGYAFEKALDGVRHFSNGHIEKLRISDASFHPIQDVIERHRAKELLKSCSRLQEERAALSQLTEAKEKIEKDKASALEKFYTKREKHGLTREDIEKMYPFKLKKLEKRYEKDIERIENGGLFHRTCIAKCTEAVKESEKEYENALKAVARDVVKNRQRAAKEIERVQNMNLSPSQKEAFAKRIEEAVVYGQNERFSDDLKAELEQTISEMGQDNVDPKDINDVEIPDPLEVPDSPEVQEWEDPQIYFDGWDPEFEMPTSESPTMEEEPEEEREHS